MPPFLFTFAPKQSETVMMMEKLFHRIGIVLAPVRCLWRRVCGLPLVYLGVALLTVRIVLVQGSGNALSLLSLALIVLGLILYVHRMKHGSRY